MRASVSCRRPRLPAATSREAALREASRCGGWPAPSQVAGSGGVAFFLVAWTAVTVLGASFPNLHITRTGATDLQATSAMTLHTFCGSRGVRIGIKGNFFLHTTPVLVCGYCS